MKNQLRLFLAMVFLGLCFSGKLAAQSITVTDVVYTPEGYPDGEQMATIYEPAQKNGVAIVFLHGLGNVRHAGIPLAWADTLAQNKFTVFSIDYPQPGSPGVQFPASPRAAKTAVEYVRKHAQTYGISKIVAFGISLGSAVWGEALVWDNDDAYFGTDSTVADGVDAAVLLYGLYDPANFLDSKLPVAFLIASYLPTPELKQKSAATLHAANFATPVLLMHGDSDSTLDYRQSVEFNDSLQAHGKTSELEIVAGGDHVFELADDQKQFTPEGNTAIAKIFTFLENTLGMPTAVAEPSSRLPVSPRLDQNYPNPFNPSTTLQFELPAAGNVTLKIYNSAGQLVRTLASGDYEAGSHKVVWDALDDRGHRVASGLYLSVMRAGDPAAGSGQVFTARRKLVLMK
jgi:acetyl esterase/lipase